MIQLIAATLLLIWGIRQARDPEKVLRRKYPMVDIPEEAFRTARWVGIVMAVAGGILLVWNLVYHLLG